MADGQGRYNEAIAVADVFLEYYPIKIHLALTRCSAHGELLRTESVERNATSEAIRFKLRPRFQMTASENAAAFEQAEAWDWTPPALLHS